MGPSAKLPRYENPTRRLVEIDELPSLREAKDWQKEFWMLEVLSWAAIIRTARAALSMNQSAFAAAVGTSGRTINAIENWETRATSGTKFKITEYLKSRGLFVDFDLVAEQMTLRVPYEAIRAGVDIDVLYRQFEKGHSKKHKNVTVTPSDAPDRNDAPKQVARKKKRKT